MKSLIWSLPFWFDSFCLEAISCSNRILLICPLVISSFVLTGPVQDSVTMTTSSSGSNWTYRTETNPLHSTVVTDRHSSIDNVGRFSGGSGGFHDDLLERQLEQARQQRTGFYQRLADVGRRRIPASTVHSESLATTGGAGRRAELLNGAGRRKRQSETTTGSESAETQFNDVVRGINDPLVFTDMSAAEKSKPQTRLNTLMIVCETNL